MKRLLDIKPLKNKRLNLRISRTVVLPIKSFFKKAFILMAILGFFVFSLTVAPAQNTNDQQQRKALETQLSEIENQIAQDEATIEKYQKQGNTLKSEIRRLEANISKLNLQIRAINLTLEKLDSEIVVTKNQISQTENEIDVNKENLSQLLQTVYESDKQPLVEILFKNPQLSDFFGDLNDLLAVQDNLRGEINKIIEARQKLVDQQQNLALERSDAAALKNYQENQKASIAKIQSEKSYILKVTKGKESEYQKILVENKKTAVEIRKQIFQLLGGGELKFEDAYQLAKMAEKATGVRAALILAVLDRESALGKNVGQCDYKTAMNPDRDIPIFLQIIKELDLGKNLDSGILKVSCANVDGAYGGAMGPAQFLPSTWILYKDKIAAITGDNPPSPWKNSDAFIATALFLKDAGAGPNASLEQEKRAAAKYYAGSRWSRYLWTYGAKVIAQAQRFEEDIAILNS